MEWNKQHIETVLQELIQENPLACRALLKICTIQFSEAIPTLSVSLSQKPILYINLSFCNEHLKSDSDLKAVLLHEFLHVLLLHTEKYECNTPLLNLCLDAVINAIIYRMQGLEYAGFFARYYPWKPPYCLLRPQTNGELVNREWRSLHQMIYSGRFAADQLIELLEYLQEQGLMKDGEGWQLIGTHPPHEKPSEEAKLILTEIMAKMQGVQIWSQKKFPGTGSRWEKKEQEEKKTRELHQKRELWYTIKQCLLETNYKEFQLHQKETLLPLLSASDKRSISKFYCSPFLPFSTVALQQVNLHHVEKFQLYLDVSGSMTFYLKNILSVLLHFKNQISSPIWTFSDEVRPAKFNGDKLCFETSYGTSIFPVLEHYTKHQFKKALLVTDGHFEVMDPNSMKGLNIKGMRALLVPNADRQRLEETGIPYHQLKENKKN